MLIRLGKVIGWTGNVLAALLTALGAYSLTNPAADRFAALFFFFAPALTIFLSGQAVKYVLSGQSST